MKSPFGTWVITALYNFLSLLAETTFDLFLPFSFFYSAISCSYLFYNLSFVLYWYFLFFSFEKKISVRKVAPKLTFESHHVQLVNDVTWEYDPSVQYRWEETEGHITDWFKPCEWNCIDKIIGSCRLLYQRIELIVKLW